MKGEDWNRRRGRRLSIYSDSRWSNTLFAKLGRDDESLSDASAAMKLQHWRGARKQGQSAKIARKHSGRDDRLGRVPSHAEWFGPPFHWRRIRYSLRGVVLISEISTYKSGALVSSCFLKLFRFRFRTKPIVMKPRRREKNEG